MPSNDGQRQSAPATGVSRGIRGAAGRDGLVSGFYLNQKAMRGQLPKTAWLLIMIVGVCGTVGAVAALVTTHRWIAPAILFFVAWLFVMSIAYMGELSTRKRDPR